MRLLVTAFLVFTLAPLAAAGEWDKGPLAKPAGPVAAVSASAEAPAVVSVAKALQPPRVFALRENYPNPFESVTTIPYDVSERRHVRVAVYDALGRPVRVLVDRTLEPGSYAVRWNGTSDSGEAMASGLYVYRLESGDFRATRRLVLLR